MQEKRKKRVVFGDLEGGKIPRQELELEEAILGALMIENDAFEKVQEILNPNSFYKDTHAKVFKAISEIHNAKEKVDILTVTAQLKKNGELDAVGGAFAVTQLTNRVAGTANLEYHARLVAESYLAREVVRIGSEFSSRGYDSMEDVFDLIDELHKEVDTLKNFGIDASGDVPMSVSIDERVKEKIEMVSGGIKLTGISTGDVRLDNIISGFNNGCVYVFGGAPSMGKSVKGLGYAKTAALQGYRVSVFSLEMSKRDYIDRLLAEDSRVPLGDYRANRMTEYDIEKIKIAAKQLKALPISIYDNASANTNYIRKKIKSDIKIFGSVDMIVVDYAQLIKGNEKSYSRENEVSTAVRELKVIAKDFDIPVILLAQVGRGIYQVNDRRPNLSHLSQSSEIENSADFVGLIHRPSFYFDRMEHPDYNDESSKIFNCDQVEYDLLSELIIVKNRAGVPNCVLYEKFYGQFSCFSKDDIYAQDVPFTEPDNSDINPIPF